MNRSKCNKSPQKRPCKTISLHETQSATRSVYIASSHSKKAREKQANTIGPSLLITQDIVQGAYSILKK